MRRRSAGPVARILTVLLACAVVTGCGGSPGGAAGAPGAEQRPTATAQRPTATAQRPTAVFLGDSYTVGVGGRGYARMVARELGWRSVLEAESGTGYVAPGPGPSTAPYGERLAAVVAARPDIVVVQGSTNDATAPAAEVGTAAAALYRELSQALPRARIVVLGPVQAPAIDPDDLRAIRDAVRTAAADAGLPFVDPLAEGWLQSSDGRFSDPVHPSPEGYDELARRLVADLRAHGLG